MHYLWNPTLCIIIVLLAHSIILIVNGDDDDLTKSTNEDNVSDSNDEPEALPSRTHGHGWNHGIKTLFGLGIGYKKVVMYRPVLYFQKGKKHNNHNNHNNHHHNKRPSYSEGMTQVSYDSDPITIFSHSNKGSRPHGTKYGQQGYRPYSRPSYHPSLPPHVSSWDQFPFLVPTRGHYHDRYPVHHHHNIGDHLDDDTPQTHSEHHNHDHHEEESIASVQRKPVKNRPPPSTSTSQRKNPRPSQKPGKNKGKGGSSSKGSKGKKGSQSSKGGTKDKPATMRFTEDDVAPQIFMHAGLNFEGNNNVKGDDDGDSENNEEWDDEESQGGFHASLSPYGYEDDEIMSDFSSGSGEMSAPPPNDGSNGDNASDKKGILHRGSTAEEVTTPTASKSEKTGVARLLRGKIVRRPNSIKDIIAGRPSNKLS